MSGKHIQLCRLTYSVKNVASFSFSTICHVELVVVAKVDDRYMD